MRFLRYCLVGALGLAVKFSMLAALIEFAHLGHLTATICHMLFELDGHRVCGHAIHS